MIEDTYVTIESYNNHKQTRIYDLQVEAASIYILGQLYYGAKRGRRHL